MQFIPYRSSIASTFNPHKMLYRRSQRFGLLYLLAAVQCANKASRMNYVYKVLCLLFIVDKVVVAQDVVREITTLMENVQKFYLSRSIYIVYNQRQFGFDREKMLLEIIKIHSHRGSMSQAIANDNLIRATSPREKVLYSILIHNRQDLDQSINATKNIDISSRLWLLIVSKTANFNCDQPDPNFFKLRLDTQMAAKCEDNRILKKYYSLFDDHTEVANLTDENFEFKRTSDEVEKNLNGLTLRLAKRRKANDEVNENNHRFVQSLISEVARIGGFKTKVTVQEDRIGHFNRKDNKWSGLMGIMKEGRHADIGMILFSLSNSRMDVVDFATPLAWAKYSFYARLPDNVQIRWDAYFQVFQAYTWTAIGLSILVFPILLCLMNFQSLTTNSFSQNFINVWGIFGMQGLAERPSNAASQILVFSILFSSVILHAIYSASITSYIARLTTNLPFSTYEEFLRDRHYKITVLKDSRDEDLFYEDDKLLIPLQSRLRARCYRANHPYEGFQQACEPNTVFYSDKVSFDGITSPPCKLDSADMRRMEHMSFILKKNSPYRRTISHFLFQLREHGILQRMKNKYFFKFTEIPDTQPNVINFEEILPILAILVGGTIAALVVLLMELVAYSFATPVRYY